MTTNARDSSYFEAQCQSVLLSCRCLIAGEHSLLGCRGIKSSVRRTVLAAEILCASCENRRALVLSAVHPAHRTRNNGRHAQHLEKNVLRHAFCLGCQRMRPTVVLPRCICHGSRLRAPVEAVVPP